MRIGRSSLISPTSTCRALLDVSLLAFPTAPLKLFVYMCVDLVIRGDWDQRGEAKILQLQTSTFSSEALGSDYSKLQSIVDWICGASWKEGWDYVPLHWLPSIPVYNLVVNRKSMVDRFLISGLQDGLRDLGLPWLLVLEVYDNINGDLLVAGDDVGSFLIERDGVVGWANHWLQARIS